MCVRHSIFNVCVTCCDLDVTMRQSETAREKARGNVIGLSHVPSKGKEEIKSETFGCGSFVVPYFQTATSIDRVQLQYSSSCQFSSDTFSQQRPKCVPKVWVRVPPEDPFIQ